MKRFVLTLLVSVLTFGCQTAPHGHEPTVIVQTQKPQEPIKRFWTKTAQLFLPDAGHRPAEPVIQSAAYDPKSQLAALSASKSSNSLYKPGSISLSPALIDTSVAAQNTEQITAQNTVPEIAETPAPKVKPATPKDPLIAQIKDSERFRELLQEIEATPAEKRGVSDEKLAQILSRFRNEMDWSKEPELEANYLAILRTKILPQNKAVEAKPKIAEETEEEIAATPKKRRRIEPEEYDEEPLEEPIAVKRQRPAGYSAATSTLTRVQQNEPHNEPQSQPQYPGLVQQPGAMPPQIVQTSYTTQSPIPMTGYGAGDWQSPTRTAIEQLRYAIEQTPHGRTASNEMRLRMLEMLLGNRVEAAKPMSSADKTLNEFMGHQVLGFAALLDDAGTPEPRSRYVSAAYRFNEGLSELQKLCPIKLKNVNLVKDWLEFGVFLPRTEEYRPGEHFTLYMELENPTVRRTTDGFNVSVAMSYEIRDMSAKVVDKQDADKPTLTTISRKQDFCLTLEGNLPKTLPPGQYQLRVNLTDLNDDTMQYAEEQITFKVAPASALAE